MELRVRETQVQLAYTFVCILIGKQYGKWKISFVTSYVVYKA